MKNLREDIRIFQDAKNNKTTIVCFNLSEKTKQKLIMDLFGDLETVETVEDITCTEPDLSPQVASTEDMMQLQDLNELIKGLNAPRAIITLADFYQTSKQIDVPNKIRELIPLIYDADDNTIRAVLFSLRNMSSGLVDAFVQQMSCANAEESRDTCVGKAISMACRDTLLDVLHQILH